MVACKMNGIEHDGESEYDFPCVPCVTVVSIGSSSGGSSSSSHVSDKCLARRGEIHLISTG